MGRQNGLVEVTIESGGLRLRGHVGLPGPGGRNLGVVLCHGFPSGARGAATAAATFPELADRIARGGWPALAFNLRGTGASEGDFDADGWLADLRAGVRFLALRGDVAGVCIIGFAEGGTLAICEAADDDLVVGVAAVSAPVRLGEWAQHPARLLEHVRRIGMVRTPDFPPDPLAWGRRVAALDSRVAAKRLAPRPLLVLHGSEDDVVSTEDARALADAAAPSSELHEVHAAGSRLRHDPRAVATLLGWIERCSN
jgi:putative redox protein